MLSEEETKNLIKKLKIYQKYKAPMLYHYKYIQHIIEVFEYIINPAIIIKIPIIKKNFQFFLFI